MKLDYNVMNMLTYLFNQQNNEGRQDLVSMIETAGGLSHDKAVNSAKYACYLNSFIFDIWFKGKTINHVGLYGLFKFVYDKEIFDPESSYQKESSFNALTMLNNAGLISDFTMSDVDSSYPGETRATVYNKLLDRMRDPDFHCARVCFGADAASDHALIVTNDEGNLPVILDTSYRSHESPGNLMANWITADNIRWFTELS